MKKRYFGVIAFFAILVMSFALPNFVKAGINPEGAYRLESISIMTETAKIGEKVYIGITPFEKVENIQKMKCQFYSNVTGQDFSVEVQDFNKPRPYFILPEIVKPGTSYTMYYIDVTVGNNTIKYTTSKDSNSITVPYVETYKSKVLNVLGKDTVSAKLDNISIKGSNKVTIGDKAYFNIKTTGNIDYISLNFYCQEINRSVTAYVENLTNNPYINTANMSDQFTANEYQLKDVFIFASNKENIHYSSQSVGSDVLPLNFDVKLIGQNPNASTDPGTSNPADNELKSISLSATKSKLNEKVMLKDFSTTLDLKKVMLSFVDEKSQKNMVVYVKSLAKNPYFVVPYTTEVGNYSLNYVVLTDKSGKEYHFRNGENYNGIKHFDFNSTLEVENAISTDNNLIDLDNSKMTDALIQQIKAMDSNVVITINASSNPIVKAAIFEAIKGSNKIIIIKYNDNEWIFNGMDIKTTKDIDASVSVTKADQKGTVDVTQMMKKGLVLNYASNGELPGKALVRISATDEMKSYMGTEKAYVYYYDANGKKLDKVAMEISLSDDGYYEFYINHNSSYVITTEKVADQFVSDNTDDLKLNSNLTSDKTGVLNDTKSTSFFANESNLQIAIVVAVAVIVILLVTIIVIISRKKK